MDLDQQKLMVAALAGDQMATPLADLFPANQKFAMNARRDPADTTRPGTVQGGGGGGGLSLPTISQRPAGSVVMPQGYYNVEDAISKYARGEISSVDVQKIAKQSGWSVNLRGNKEIEAFDPLGKQHWILP